MTDSYLRPEKIDHALAALAERRRVIVAGGTDFYPQRVGKPLNDAVLDITALQELKGICEDRDVYRIGALTTWTDVIRAPLPAWFDGLKLAGRELGGVQVQNAGTVCGNICNASPAADGTPNLLALDAVVELRSARDTRTLPLAEFVTGNRRTNRKPDELVTAVLVPKPPDGACSTFLKLGARKYLVISIVMVAAVLATGDDGSVTHARFAVGACSAVAQRLPALESELLGRRAGPELAALVEARHLSPLSPIDDIRATASYRRDAALISVRRAVGTLSRHA
ncbi:MAG: FAD binding domain-containing protein [Acidiferrobacterales bacterium]